jgi:hypothetical protein
MNQVFRKPSEFGDIWDNILSQDKEKVREILKSLNKEIIDNIIIHLSRMTTEAGWHPSQKKSAKFALDIIYQEIKAK